MVARLEQAHAHHQDGGHARSRRHGGLAAFQDCQALLETGHRRVTVAPVGKALLFAAKAPRSGGRRLLHITAGQVQGFGVLTVLTAFQSLAHGQRVAMQPGRQLVVSGICHAEEFLFLVIRQSQA